MFVTPADLGSPMLTFEVEPGDKLNMGAWAFRDQTTTYKTGVFFKVTKNGQNILSNRQDLTKTNEWELLQYVYTVPALLPGDDPETTVFEVKVFGTYDIVDANAGNDFFVDNMYVEVIHGDYDANDATNHGELVFLPDVRSFSNYYPFGWEQPNRSLSGDGYRYGFNGMEKDDEIAGKGASYTTLFRQYDPRVGRWNAIDPATAYFADKSPYNFVFNNPITTIDPKGDCPPGEDCNSEKQPDGTFIDIPLSIEDKDITYGDDFVLESFNYEGKFFSQSYDKSGNFLGYANVDDEGGAEYYVDTQVDDNYLGFEGSATGALTVDSYGAEVGILGAKFGGLVLAHEKDLYGIRDASDISDERNKDQRVGGGIELGFGSKVFLAKTDANQVFRQTELSVGLLKYTILDQEINGRFYSVKENVSWTVAAKAALKWGFDLGLDIGYTYKGIGGEPQIPERFKN